MHFGTPLHEGRSMLKLEIFMKHRLLLAAASLALVAGIGSPTAAVEEPRAVTSAREAAARSNRYLMEISNFTLNVAREAAFQIATFIAPFLRFDANR